METVAAISTSAPVTLGVLHTLTACSGSAVVIGRARLISAADTSLVDPPIANQRMRGQPSANQLSELGLASLLGEREAKGTLDQVVVLRMQRRDDAIWVRAAVPWLHQRGRRVVVRSQVVIGRALAKQLQECGVPLLLELAHSDSAVQQAVLGSAADSVASLLLHAQHLRSLGVDVCACIGPLLPLLHDRDERLAGLLQHIAAADLRDAHLYVGRLTLSRFAALRKVLPWPTLCALARAFGVDAHATQTALSRSACLSNREGWLLRHNAVRMVQARGIRVDACGCSLQCHLGRRVDGEPSRLLTADLFAASAG